MSNPSIFNDTVFQDMMFLETDAFEEKYYASGIAAARYPVPAIPLQVKYDYVGCINIDDVSDPDDPVILYMFDTWTGLNV